MGEVGDAMHHNFFLHYSYSSKAPDNQTPGQPYTDIDREEEKHSARQMCWKKGSVYDIHCFHLYSNMKICKNHGTFNTFFLYKSFWFLVMFSCIYL